MATSSKQRPVSLGDYFARDRHDPRFTTISGLLTSQNPVVVIEVLSPSTATNDCRAEFRDVRS